MYPITAKRRAEIEAQAAAKDAKNKARLAKLEESSKKNVRGLAHDCCANCFYSHHHMEGGYACVHPKDNRKWVTVTDNGYDTVCDWHFQR